MTSKYTIKELEKLSGIKAHTLRIWEQRYNIIEPRRTETNIRFYEDEHLKKILNVSTLVKGGMKISKVAKLNDEDLRQAVLDTGNYHSSYDKHINALKIAMIDYDEDLFNSVFDKCILQFGIEETLVHIMGVFLGQIGMLWLANSINVTNEHFVSNLVKQKLFSISDQLVMPKPKEDDPAFILYLPEQELHELSLLYLYYFLKKRGFRVVYLGQSVPLESLVEIRQKTGIDSFVSIFTSNPVQSEVQSYFQKFKDTFGDNSYTLYCTGTQISSVNPSDFVDDNIVVYPHVEEMKKSIA